MALNNNYGYFLRYGSFQYCLFLLWIVTWYRMNREFSFVVKSGDGVVGMKKCAERRSRAGCQDPRLDQKKFLMRFFRPTFNVSSTMKILKNIY